MITALFQAMESVELLCQVMTSRGSLESEWNTQIRFYLEKSDGASLSHPGEIYMRLGVNQIKYGYEYIGTMPRLIIAPATAKAFDHLIEAVRQNTLCCFYGPSDFGILLKLMRN
jgi:hypothetical protein